MLHIHTQVLVLSFILEAATPKPSFHLQVGSKLTPFPPQKGTMPAPNFPLQMMPSPHLPSSS